MYTTYNDFGRKRLAVKVATATPRTYVNFSEIHPTNVPQRKIVKQSHFPSATPSLNPLN